MKFSSLEFGWLGVMLTGMLLFSLYPDSQIRKRGAGFFLGWFFPGAGHALLGKWRKGLLFALLLCSTYAMGLWICGFRTVSFSVNPFYYVGEFGCGLFMLFGSLMGTETAFPRPDLPISWYSPGLLYVCIAGLLNIVVALNVLENKKRENGKQSEHPSEPAASPMSDSPPEESTR